MAKPPKKPTGEKQKPGRAVVHQGMKDLASKSTSAARRSEGGRIGADQKNDPLPNKKDPSPTKADKRYGPRSKGKK